MLERRGVPAMLPRRRLLIIALVVPAILLAQRPPPRGPDSENSNGKTVSVIGKVNRPGKVALWNGMGVYEAIVKAYGFTDSANKKKITITRGGEQYTFDADAYIRGKNVEQNIPLQDGDVIEVP